MPINVSDVAIIGGGIMGCALAYDLAARDVRVTIFERGMLAREASWASAGIISPPAPRFGPLTELALLSFRRYPGMIDEVEQASGISTAWNLTGETVLGKADDKSALEDLAAWQNENGITAELLGSEELREMEPAIQHDFEVGVYTPNVASVLLDRAAVAIASAASEHGAKIKEHAPVDRIEVSGGRAVAVVSSGEREPVGGVIIAGGAWSRALSESIDFPIPTVPVRGQMMAVDQPVPRLNSIIAHDGVYLVPRADGTIAIGATEEPGAGFASEVTPRGIRWLTDRAERLAPTIADARLVSTWAGLRPGSEDGLPIIGPVPHLDNVWIASGHFRSGALLASGTSQLLAELIVDGKESEILQAFAPARFG